MKRNYRVSPGALGELFHLDATFYIHTRERVVRNSQFFYWSLTSVGKCLDASCGWWAGRSRCRRRGRGSRCSQSRWSSGRWFDRTSRWLPPGSTEGELFEGRARTFLALTDTADAEAAGARAARHSAALEALAGRQASSVVAGNGAALQVIEAHHREEREDCEIYATLIIDSGGLKNLQFLYARRRCVLSDWCFVFLLMCA